MKRSGIPVLAVALALSYLSLAPTLAAASAWEVSGQVSGVYGVELNASVANTFTVSSPGYWPAMQTVGPLGDGPAGMLMVEPASLEVILLLGDSTTVPLRLDNTGAMASEFEIEELNGDFVPTIASGESVEWLHQSSTGVSVDGADSGQRLAFPGAYRYVPTGTTGSGASILIYTDDWWHTTPNTYPELAVAHLELPATIFVDGNYAGFTAALTDNGPWDLVIWSGENFVVPDATLTALLGYVNGGGALAASYWRQLDLPDHPLWAAMGFEYLANELDAAPAYWWEGDHRIFNQPEAALEWIERFARSGLSQGSFLGTLGDSLVVAGYTTTSQPGQGNIVIREDGRTVYKGIRDLSTDADSNGSGLADAAELWANIIVGLLGGFSTAIPWLDQDPKSGTVQAMDSTTINVTFDAGVPEVSEPGFYHATLRVHNDTPNGELDIPVTMRVVNVIHNAALDPEIDAASGLVGSTVDYLLELSNQGSATDTFQINLSGHAWAASLSEETVTLGVGETTDVTVAVVIPANATSGDTDTVTISVASPANPVSEVLASSQLTTIGIIIHTAELNPAFANAHVLPGTAVDYTLEVTNAGSHTDNFTFLASGNIWTTIPTPLSVTLDPNESTLILATVFIPASAAVGFTDTATFQVLSQTSPAPVALAGSILTTSTVPDLDRIFDDRFAKE